MRFLKRLRILSQVQRGSEAHQGGGEGQLDSHHGSQEVRKPAGMSLKPLGPCGRLLPVVQSIARPSAPRPLQELVEYYQSHSLKESFKQLDTTLKYPYKSRERSTSRTFTRSPGKTRLPQQASSCSWWKSSRARSEQGGYSCSPPGSVLAAFPLVVSHTRDFKHHLVQREHTGSCLSWSDTA